METKRCARCKQDLPIEKFEVKNDKPYCWCITCAREYRRLKAQEYRRNPGIERPRNRVYLTLPPAEEILKMVESSTVTEVARTLGCCSLTIIDRLKRGGLYRSFTRKVGVVVDIEVLHDMYFNKMLSFREIRTELGCTQWHIQSTFRKQGWVPRSPGRAPKNTLVIRTTAQLV